MYSFPIRITIHIHLFPNRIHRRSRETVNNPPHNMRVRNHDGISYTHSHSQELESPSCWRPILIPALIQCWFKANVIIKCHASIITLNMNVTTNTNQPHSTNQQVNQSEQTMNQSTNRWKINHSTHHSNDQTITNNQPPHSLIEHAINRTANQSTNPSNNPLINNHSFHKSINPPIKGSTKQSINISNGQPVTPSATEHSIAKAIKQLIDQ